MWSFIISAVAFVLLVAALGLWQYCVRKQTRVTAEQADHEIYRVAEIAQRRYRERYGKDDTSLQQTFGTSKS